MISIIALTFLSAITASAIPHGHQHFHLHPARSPRNLITHNVQHVGEAIVPIAGRSDLPISLNDGVCGGTSGFGCGEGYCCSKWGYCGVSEDYCGAGCQFGNCNGTATGPTTPPASNATALQPAEYSSVYAPGPVVTVQLTVTATGAAPEVTLTTSNDAAPTHTVTSTSEAAPEMTSSAENEGISAAGVASKVHGPPAYSQSWAPLSEGWGQPESSAAVVPTTFATQTSAPVVAPTTTPYSSVSVPSSTPVSSSATAPVETSSSAAAPAYSQPASTGTGNGGAYVSYTGNGTPQEGWPSEEEWMSFDDLWNHNLANIALNCDNSDEENSELKSAISSVSASSGVPANFIFAIIMQESHACVRVPGTVSPDGVGNPGLMQSHSGLGSCNSNGNKITPCPNDMITKMVSDGVEGTSYVGSNGGLGLVQLIQQADSENGCSGVSSYYTAARLYNSGETSFPAGSTNLLTTVLAATVSYPADIANRLMGYIK